MPEAGQGNAAERNITGQIDLLLKLQAFTPPPFVMGGIAEDALLAGRFTRPHGDLDLLVERAHLDAVLHQLLPLGYRAWATKGENARGEPFYLAAQDADVPIEIGVLDRDEGRELFIEIARVAFRLATGDAPVGYRVYLPADTFAFPPQAIEGIRIRCISPLANYQLRTGIASRGTFGPLRETDIIASERLRAAFLNSMDEQSLQPRVEPLPSAGAHEQPGAG